MGNLAISVPGKCKIGNLGIKISKTPKYGLWEMVRSWVLPVLTARSVRNPLKCHTNLYFSNELGSIDDDNWPPLPWIGPWG